MSAVLNNSEQWCHDYQTIERAISFIEMNHEEQPSLAEIAESVQLSEFHFQKLFSRWVGISPKRFLQFLTKEFAKNLLDESKNILDVTYETGLSSPGRLHDLFIHCEAMTPGEYKSMGKGLEITYGICFSPFGICMIANTSRGICGLKFLQGRNEKALFQWVKDKWPEARITRDDQTAIKLGEKIFPFSDNRSSAPLHLYVKGTNFQIKVWEALSHIPFGHTVSYQDIADHIGHPQASRAVGTAVGKNPIPFLIPCHRVIRKMGIFGNYAEGRTRKKAIIGWEAAKRRVV